MKTKSFRMSFVLAFFALLLLLVACGKKVESVVVTGDAEVELGDTADYQAVITPDGAAEAADVSWTVENGTGSATISASGVLTAVAKGKVTVKATVKEVVGQLEVTIVSTVSGVAITGDDSIYVGETKDYSFTVNPTTADYETAVWAPVNGTGSITVTQAGKVTGGTAGTAVLRLTLDGSTQNSKTITILTPVANVAVDGPDEVRLGSTGRFTAIEHPTGAHHEGITFEVVNGTGEATIDDEGVLTPVAAGMVTVKAIANSLTEVVGQKQVKIVVPVESVEIAGDDEIYSSDRPTYTATVLPANADYKTVTWSIVAGNDYATINAETGALLPVASGEITIRATADGVYDEFVVNITADDRLLGSALPNHVACDPDNAVVIDEAWQLEDPNLVGMSIDLARMVYDVEFDVAASISNSGVFLEIPNTYDISRTSYFAIKVTGFTTTENVNPSVSVQLRDWNSGFLLYRDQETEKEITEDHQWVIFSIANRYRLQTDYRDLRIHLDPHYTSSGNEGKISIERVVFFGDNAPQSEIQYTSGFKTAHWDSALAAVPSTDTIGEETVNVVNVSSTAETLSAWKSLPNYVLDDISRFTTINFKVKLLTEGLTSNPKFEVTLGDSKITDVQINRTNTVDYQQVTVVIPAAMRLEQSMWSAKYIQIKPNIAGNTPFEINLYDFNLSGDADPTAVSIPRNPVGGANVKFNITNPNWKDGNWAYTAATETDPAFGTLTSITTTGKAQFTGPITGANTALRAGLNGVYVKVQGPAGTQINLQRNWEDDWADDSERILNLDGTVQEFYILAKNRSIITGSENKDFQFNFFCEVGDVLTIYDLAFTAIQIPEEPKPTRPGDIFFNEFHVAGLSEMISVDYTPEGYSEVTITEDAANNQVRAVVFSYELKYKNTILILMDGVAGAKFTVKINYGNEFFYGQVMENELHPCVFEFTEDGLQSFQINIGDMDQVNYSMLSIEIIFDLSAVTITEPVVFVIRYAKFCETV